ncbi:hypothetical protein KY290_026135 [Solanum tuberosum]|uniref:Uncharacterized protein n=1 Tax=Solanum tuberosum TaxID=4113 RepID=A0ABQ7UVJ4_SOLTU|nr:hypothetical protein KY289_025228 [Solanum tuberosum]KAH0673901.1 hypothetical protein KY284_024988 [Solanum tuberosum]KAH0755865.1 hypothetical protein KY290_026135 [Solanum tuberosum]
MQHMWTQEILPIVELEGEESSVDLLNFLPKASGKLSHEEDKKRKKSKKRKHINRDKEQEDILKLRGGRRASSSLVPTKVGLISGVDVVRESQTLTTTPPAYEGTLEVSLSVSATIGTTIHVLGDTKASAPIPEA